MDSYSVGAMLAADWVELMVFETAAMMDLKKAAMMVSYLAASMMAAAMVRLLAA